MRNGSQTTGLIAIFDVLSYSSPKDWPGKNHADEITQWGGGVQSYKCFTKFVSQKVGVSKLPPVTNLHI